MRTDYSIKNSITSFISNIINYIFLFIGQTLFIKILGIEYTGLNGLFSNILYVLNFFELGIGSSITYNLYKYVKNNDTETIKSIMNFYKKAYNYIIAIIFIIGILLLPFLKFFIKEPNIDINIYLSYFLFLLTTVSTYILSYKRNLIFVNQKKYILNIIHIIYIIILNILQILVIYFTKNYYLYLIVKIICNILENVYIAIKTNKMYSYIKQKNIKDLDENVKTDIISRVKALIVHKLATALVLGTDNIIISSFLGLATVGLYTSYNYIITAVKSLFGGIIQSTSASVGNLLVEKNKEKNYKVFKKIFFLNYWIAVSTSVCLLLLIEPFITLWLGKKYLLETSVLVILIAGYFQTMMRNAFMVFKDSAGIWIEDKFVPLMESLINIIASIILLKFLGLKGVFIGTILSSLVLWCYSYPKYVYINLFNKKLKEYIIKAITHVILFISILIISFMINKYSNNIITSGIISVIIPNIILYLIYRSTEEFKYYKKLIVKKTKIMTN